LPHVVCSTVSRTYSDALVHARLVQKYRKELMNDTGGNEWIIVILYMPCLGRLFVHNNVGFDYLSLPP
jgi:hypothetical protein